MRLGQVNADQINVDQHGGNGFRRRLLRVVLCSILLWVPALSYGETVVEIYGDDSYAPYSYLENGKITGIYTVVLEALFSKMPDYTVRLSALPWKRGLSQVEDGEIFALYPPYERRKERPYMDYDVEILDEELVVVCRDTVLATPRPRWPDDYYGLSIGNNAGFAAGGDAFWAAVKAGKIQVQESKGTPGNLKKLIAGRVDCYMNDGLSIQWELKKFAQEGKYDGKSIVKGAVISEEKGFLGFAVKADKFPYKDDFKKQYLSVLQEMKANGDIARIVEAFVAQ